MGFVNGWKAALATQAAATTLHTFTSAQLDQVRADAWDEAIERARGIVGHRTGTYEADIDLLSEPNPYREGHRP